MRPELPTGTVTFVFTDVEGSTTLLQSLGALGDASYEGAVRGGEDMSQDEAIELALSSRTD